MTLPSADIEAGYWYPHDDASKRGVEVLSAMRRYRAAEQAMRRRTRGSMGMGETDLLALRILLDAQNRNRMVTAKELAQRLEISSASTTVLIDRLERSGHVRRRPHPTDRRAVVIEATADSDHEVKATLGRMHAGMLEVADALSPAESQAVIAFLDRLRDVVEQIDDTDSGEQTA